MPAISRNLVIEIGTDWSHDFVAVDRNGDAINLDGYSLRMQIRDSYRGGIVEEPALTITDAPAGRFRASLAAAETERITAARGVYDIEAVSPSETVTRLYQGEIFFSPEVTRS